MGTPTAVIAAENRCVRSVFSRIFRWILGSEVILVANCRFPAAQSKAQLAKTLGIDIVLRDISKHSGRFRL